MTDRLQRAAQHAIPALQQRRRDPETFAPTTTPHQMWLCPHCKRLHENVPINVKIYRCICSWNGTRSELCRGDMSCLTTT